MVSRRKCCVIDCNKTFRTHSMFSFPKVDTSGLSKERFFLHKEFRRCLFWIQYSGNALLLEQRPESLSGRFFLCSEHFEKDQFVGCTRKQLKKNSYPKLNANCGISDEDICRYISNVLTFNSNPQCKKDVPLRITAKNQKKMSLCRPRFYDSDTGCRREKDYRSCSVIHCSWKEERMTVFAFPRASRLSFAGAPIHIENYNRCKVWLQASGNEDLLKFSPLQLWKHAWICSKHFGDNHFFSKMKKKLLQNAIPTQHLPKPICDLEMEGYCAQFGSGKDIL